MALVAGPAPGDDCIFGAGIIVCDECAIQGHIASDLPVASKLNPCAVRDFVDAIGADQLTWNLHPTRVVRDGSVLVGLRLRYAIRG